MEDARVGMPRAPHGPVHSRGTRRLVGVGVGPGDPEHVTLKAVRLLGEADLGLVPATERSGAGPGRAEAIVRAVCPGVRGIRRVPFSMADTSGVSAQRRTAWALSAAAAVEAFAAGARLVCLATIGDPSVYSTFSYLAGTVRADLPDVAIEVVPGITAMQALAAASRIPLVEGTEVLALVPVTAGMDALERALGAADTVVAYKAGRRLPEVVARLAAHGRAAGGVLGTDIGLPGERIEALPVGTPEGAAPYFSTVLSAPRRAGIGGRL